MMQRVLGFFFVLLKTCILSSNQEKMKKLWKILQGEDQVVYMIKYKWENVESGEVIGLTAKRRKGEEKVVWINKTQGQKKQL